MSITDLFLNKRGTYLEAFLGEFWGESPLGRKDKGLSCKEIGLRIRSISLLLCDLREARDRFGEFDVGRREKGLIYDVREAIGLVCKYSLCLQNPHEIISLNFSRKLVLHVP